MVEVLLHLVEPLTQFGEIHRREFGDVLVPDTIGEGFTVQSLSVTLRALTFCKELVGPLLAGRTVIVVHHVAQVLDDTVERDIIVAGGVDKILVDAHVLQRAVKHFAKSLFGDVFDRCLQVKIIFLQDGLYLPEDHLVLVFPEGDDTAFVDALTTVGDHFREVDLIDNAQSFTVRTSPLGRIERKVVRRRV